MRDSNKIKENAIPFYNALDPRHDLQLYLVFLSIFLAVYVNLQSYEDSFLACKVRKKTRNGAKSHSLQSDSSELYAEFVGVA